MKIHLRPVSLVRRGIPVLFASLTMATLASADPQYQIYDIGVVMGDSASQGFGASPGGIAVGRSFGSAGTEAFTWTLASGRVTLPNLSGRNYCVSNSANDSGTVVGTGSTTAFGSGRLPVVWQSGVVSQLPLPSGQTLGDANSVNTGEHRRRFGRQRHLAARRHLQRRQRHRHHPDDDRRQLFPDRIWY